MLTCILTRSHRDTCREKPLMIKKDGKEAARSQGSQGFLEEVGATHPLSLQRVMLPCQYLEFGLLISRTVTMNFCDSSHHVLASSLYCIPSDQDPLSGTPGKTPAGSQGRLENHLQLPLTAHLFRLPQRLARLSVQALLTPTLQGPQTCDWPQIFLV